MIGFTFFNVYIFKIFYFIYLFLFLFLFIIIIIIFFLGGGCILFINNMTTLELNAFSIHTTVWWCPAGSRVGLDLGLLYHGGIFNLVIQPKHAVKEQLANLYCISWFIEHSWDASCCETSRLPSKLPKEFPLRPLVHLLELYACINCMLAFSTFLLYSRNCVLNWKGALPFVLIRN